MGTGLDVLLILLMAGLTAVFVRKQMAVERRAKENQRITEERLGRTLRAMSKRLASLEAENAMNRGTIQQQEDRILTAVRLISQLRDGVLRLAHDDATVWEAPTPPLLEFDEAAANAERARIVAQNIGEFWSQDEMHELCLVLGVQYENLAGETRRGRAQALVEWARRHNRMDELVAVARVERPFLGWPD